MVYRCKKSKSPSISFPFHNTVKKKFSILQKSKSVLNENPANNVYVYSEKYNQIAIFKRKQYMEHIKVGWVGSGGKGNYMNKLNP